MAAPEREAVSRPGALHVIEHGALVLAMACILAICALVVTGVMTRAIFNWSLPDMEIVVRNLMIGAVILPLAYVSAQKAHIAVDVFVALLPDRYLPVISLLGSVVGFLVLVPITYGGWLAFHAAWTEGAYSFGTYNLPEWPVRLTFWLGYLIFAIRLAVMVAGDFLSVLRGGAMDGASRNEG
jgi:TRAP-type C4-dicarboxylate transport system permease small subunit